MIPLPAREKLVVSLLNGMNMNDAIKASKIPKASLYRLFKDQPAFKDECDRAMEIAISKLEKDNLNYLKNLVNKKK